MTAVRNELRFEKISATLGKEIEVRLVRLATMIVSVTQQMIRNMGGIYMGTMAGSMAASPVEVTEQGYAVEFGTPLEYGAYYEWGTRAHMPPFEPIRRWVERKIQPHVLSVGVEFSSGKARPTRAGTRMLTGDRRTREIYRVAKAIQLAISKRGTRAHEPMRQALEKIGVPYALVQGTNWFYSVDVGAWIAKEDPDFWNQVAQA